MTVCPVPSCSIGTHERDTFYRLCDIPTDSEN